MRDFAWVLGRIRDLSLRHGGVSGVHFRRASWPAELAVGLCGKLVTWPLEGWVDISSAYFSWSTRTESEPFNKLDAPLVSWKIGRPWVPEWAELLANDWEVAK